MGRYKVTVTMLINWNRIVGWSHFISMKCLILLYSISTNISKHSVYHQINSR